VVRVAPQNFPQKRLGLRFLPQSQPRLRLQEQGRGLLPEWQIVLEQQQGRQRGRKVVSFGGRTPERARVGQQVKQKLFCLPLPAEFFQRQRRPAGHFAEGADAHLLKIAPEAGGGEPVLPGLLFLAEQIIRHPRPVMYVALVGQQMPGFAEIFRREERVLKMAGGAGKIMLRQGLASEGELRANVLSQRPALAAFPRLKLALGQEMHGFDVPAGLIQQRAEFQR